MVRSILARLPGGRPSGNEHPTQTPLGLLVLFASLLFFGAVLAVSARAESVGPAESPGPADPPARVGRLAHVDGVVSFRAAGQDQWSAATLNYPVTSGDALWTEPGAHAVVEIGPAAIRLGGGTELDAAQIDLHVAQLQLAQGITNIRLDMLPAGDIYVVATPRGTVSLLEPGLYRIDAGAADQPTRVVAFRGAAVFASGGSSLTVEPGQAVDISGQETLAYAVHAAAEDPFDRWAAVRDERPAPARAAPAQSATVEPVPGQTTQYVSPEATGYQDLDRYGTWNTTPEYGAVWYPTAVQEGWAPYRYGHWAWVAPWGWTWIDDAPWGFTPFHYGRWVFIGDRWAWVPGVPVAEPVYAPALVTFIGGADWSVVVAEGPVAAFGWIPLAPEEIFIPFFDCSPTFIRQVNITNVNEVVINQVINQNVTINNTVSNTVVNKHVDPIGGVPTLANGQTVLANKHANPIGGVPNFANGQTVFANQNAATVVAHKDFVAGRPVAKAALGVTPAALKTAPVVTASGPASLPHPVATDTAAAQSAPRPHGGAPLRVADPALHGLPPAHAALHESGHAPATMPPNKAENGLPSAGAPAPRVVRGDVVGSAPGPHPVPAVVPAHPTPSTQEAHGMPAAAQPHPALGMPQPHSAPGVPQPHPAQSVPQPHSAQPVAQPHPVQPAAQPHPVQQFAQPHQTLTVPQPRPVQQFAQPRATPSTAPLHNQAPAPVPAPAAPHASAPQPHPMPQIATLPAQPHSMSQPIVPNRSVSVPPAHAERAAPPVARVMPSAAAPQSHPMPRIASLPPGPRAVPPAAHVMPSASLPHPMPQIAHVAPSAPAPQPHIAAPAARTASPQSQGNPAPAHGHQSQAPYHGDQNN